MLTPARRSPTPRMRCAWDYTWSGDLPQPVAPYHPTEDTYSSYIEFDVAVTVTEGAERKGGIGVAAGIFAIGGQGKTETQSGTVSRIKFSVPVMLPSGKNLRPRNRDRLPERAETDFDPFGS